MTGSVLFIVPYPPKVAPSQRFRVELYEPVLKEHGVDYRIVSFMDGNTWSIIFKKGHHLAKAWGVVKGYFRRISHLALAVRYDHVFIHREAAPLGPPVFEWILTRVLRKRVIYDFDDAIWIPNISAANKMARSLKAFWKVGNICRWSYRVTAGNAYLGAYAAAHGAHTIFLPTCVDVVRKHNKVKEHTTGKPVVGWTGSHSTLHYLNGLIPVIRELQEEYAFTFLVIADKRPDIELADWQFVSWQEQTEIEDLLKMDIGVMPLRPDAWSEGKCGFKLIQYLACGIPALASPVGVNAVIIEDGANGYICGDAQTWKQQLQRLVTDPALRQQLGRSGREKIVREYSIQSQTDKFLALFAGSKPE